MQTTLRMFARSLVKRRPRNFGLALLSRRSYLTGKAGTVNSSFRFWLWNRAGRISIFSIGGLATGYFLWHNPIYVPIYQAYADSIKLEKEEAIIDPFVENPWRNTLPTTYYEKMKIVFGSIILAPLRVLFLIPVVLGIMFLLSLKNLTSSRSGYRPVHWFRNIALIVPARILARLVLFIAGFYWIKRGGLPPNSQDAPIIVVAQHSNLMDVIACFVFHGATFVAKSEVQQVPVIGFWSKAIQCLFIERRSKESRSRCVREIKDRTRSYFSEPGFWHPLAIYPEGTVTNGRVMLQFKLGAFIPAAPVLPMCITQPHTHFNPALVNPYEVLNPTKEAPSSWIMWRTLCQFRNYMEISYLPVQRIEDSEGVEEFAKRVQGKMAAHIGVPIYKLTKGMQGMLS